MGVCFLLLFQFTGLLAKQLNSLSETPGSVQVSLACAHFELRIWVSLSHSVIQNVKRGVLTILR